MAQSQSQSIPQEKFLLMAVNLLHRAFVEAARTDAKRVYRELEAGKPVHLATVEMEDKSTARFGISMDHSEFRGRLNYGAFRASLATLLGNITATLKEEKDIAVFDTGESGDSKIFGVTALTVENDKPNVMVLGTETGSEEAMVLLRLMYLDPAQFDLAQDGADSGVS